MSAVLQCVSSASSTSQKKQSVASVSSVTNVSQRKQIPVAALIARLLEAQPDTALTTADVAIRAYGVELAQITKSHRVACIRAMRSTSRKVPAYRLLNGEGPHGQLIIFNSHSVDSYARARLKADWICRYQWTQQYGMCWVGDERQVEEEFGDKRHSELRMQGGAWYEHVQQWVAEDTGDRKTWLRMEIERRKQGAAWLAAFPFRRGPLTQEQIDRRRQRAEELAALESEYEALP